MPTAFKPKQKTQPNFDPAVLDDWEKEMWEHAKTRIDDLKVYRREAYRDLETVWLDADKDYIPHRLRSTGRRVITTADDDKGWRGPMVTLGTEDWQSDIAQPNPYIKTQTALAILVDQNPTGVFTATTKRYENTSALMKQLYQRSWEYAKSVQQLRLFVFNLAKYGWAVGRTYPLIIKRKIKNLVSFNPDDPDKSEYEDKEVTEYNDVYRENLDPWNVWIDDMARPNNPLSIRDWCWRKVYPMDVATEEFGNYNNWKFVKAGGNVQPRLDYKEPTSNIVQQAYKEKDLVEIFFYENRLKDLFVVEANGVPVIVEPLPISDASGNKKLSLWQAYWTLRDANSPYGIGLYEAMRHDNALLDRIRNMTIDQLTLSIYKMFFYTGTGNLTETGDIKIKPGVGKQTLDPKNITWLNIPGPGAEAWAGLEKFSNDVDSASGITPTLEGEMGARTTAFQVAQAKEGALKRLKVPLDNILDALDQEGYITISLIQLIYSIPETYKVTDPGLIEAYLKEVEGDPSLYERDEYDNFVAKVYREFPINLQTDEENNLIETEETRIFRIKPQYLKWEGIINIKAQSILAPSKQLEKTLDLEMFNMLIPLMNSMNQERMLLAQSNQSNAIDDLTQGKVAKTIVKLYDKDPRDIFPDSWFKPSAPQQQPLVVPAGKVQHYLGFPGGASQAANPQPASAQPQAPQSQKMVANPRPMQTKGVVNQVIQKAISPLINR